jgi:hypothetical protein
MAVEKIIVLDPTFELKNKENLMAPRPSRYGSISRIGFLWNSKPNGDVLLEAIKDKLTAKLGLASTSWYQKDSPSSPASPDILTKLANESDMVITATAD